MIIIINVKDDDKWDDSIFAVIKKVILRILIAF